MARLLEVDDIAVTFGGLQALAAVSLAVSEGEIVGLIGPNGAGKTTLFNVISGLQRTAAGAVRFAGMDITELGANRRARLGIGRSFQHLGLIGDETVSVNLLAAQYMGAGYSGAETLARPWHWWAEERRMRQQAEELAKTFDLTEHLEQRVDDLSFGFARFTELACVIGESPRLLLLDEPTTGLDLGEIDRLLTVLRSERDKGRTILVVAHDVRFVMGLCDTVFVLAQGKILASGTPAEVQQDPDVVAAYLGPSQ